jgi:hypothetical protein
VSQVTTAAPRLPVVLPALKEQANVGAVVGQVGRSLPETGSSVLDHGWSEGTAATGREAGARVARPSTDVANAA